MSLIYLEENPKDSPTTFQPFNNIQTLIHAIMKTYNENATLADFDAWSGAKDTKETILEADKGEEFDSMIEELYPEGLSETQLNDLLWFDSEWVFESLGISEEE